MSVPKLRRALTVGACCLAALAAAPAAGALPPVDAVTGSGTVGSAAFTVDARQSADGASGRVTARLSGSSITGRVTGVRTTGRDGCVTGTVTRAPSGGPAVGTTFVLSAHDGAPGAPDLLAVRPGPAGGAPCVPDLTGAQAVTRGGVAVLDQIADPQPEPGPNQAPVAAFQVVTTGPTVTVDGSASADADGSVVGWAWTFGDGSTGSGPTASHSYAAAGTYPVTLTVTDDDGATARATRDVTVTVAPGPDTTAPLLIGRTPAVGAPDVARTVNITATFSEDVTGVSGSTFRLTSAAGSLVAATLTYNATTHVATIDPVATLAANSTWRASLSGGATAIRDLAGNPLATTSWTFTTGAG
jgi:PKD repeat protein